MNERIKELTVEADNYAYKMNPEEDSYGRPANPRKFQQERDAKFAELIVLECAGIVQTYMSRWPEDAELTKQIKEHFGVEE